MTHLLKMSRGKLYAGLAFFGALILAITLILTNSNLSMALLPGRASSTDYTITLDSSNSVSSAGDHVQHTKRGSNVTFTYSNVTSSSNKHVRINNGGSIINKDHILSIESFTAVYSGTGTLSGQTAYVTTKLSDSFNMVSGQTVHVDGTHPYFVKLSASGGYIDLESFTINFSCQVNSDAEEQDTSGSYTIVFKDGSGDGTNFSNGPELSDIIQSGIDHVDDYSYSGNIYYQGSNGLKIGKSGGSGSIELTLASSSIYEVSTIVVNCKKYNTSKTVSFNVNNVGQQTMGSSSSFADMTFNINDEIETITLYASQYCWVHSITINYGGKTEPGTPEAPVYETGVTAVDANKDNYTTNSVFDNENALTVEVILSNGQHQTVIGYTYEVQNQYGVAINTSEKFPTEGSYTLYVTYGNYLPVEIPFVVGEYVYVTDVSASTTKTTYTTADALSNFLEGYLTANVEFSNDTYGESIAYSEFASNGIGIKLLNPKGITYTFTNPFGTAGTWTLKVYNLTDENMYYNISLTVNAIPVTNIAMSEASISMQVEGTHQLSATIQPSNATNQDYVWASLDESIATVDENGLVTAVAVGGTTITATAQDGSGVYGSCTVTVTAKPAEPTYTLVTSNSTLKNGDTVVITTIRTTSPISGVTGWNGTKDATVSTTVSEWATYTVGSASSSGWTLYDSAASKYITTPSDNGFYYGEQSYAGTCSVDSSGHLVCNSRYLCQNSSYYRMYKSIGSYTPYYVYSYESGSGSSSTPVYPTSISLSAESSSISIGATTQLTVSYTPSDTNVKNVTYTSSNESIATVSNAGLVTGVAQGSATITATAQTASGTTSATTTITVTPIAVTSVSLSSNSETIKVGKTVTLIPTISPSNATNKNVTWSSSNTGIATVSEGVVTGVSAGTATITVGTVDGNKTATCTVVVQAGGGEETFTITYTDLPSAYSTTDTVYTADSGIKFQAYNCAGGYSSKMQFRASSGYLQTTENLELQTVTINDRESNELTVYGSNTAGSFSTVITGSNDVYDLSGYTYFKVARTGSGAGYCSSITVVTGTPTPTDPTDIILSPTSAELAPNGTKQISVSYVPSNANQNKQITWTSSNTNVATVSSDGLVSVKSTATAGQSATITAKLTNIPNISKTFTVSVIEQQKDDHTVLIYMCGADLETDNQLATGDITEILKISNQPSDVNIVIETGGAKTWSSKYGISSTNLERWHVSNKSLVKDDSLTYASMGSTSTLQSFIEYGLNNYPADRTGLVFWNHGGGMRGVCYDEKKNDDVLKNSEIRSAVSGALSNCGMSGQKLEWVGYDACLMAVQDIAITNSQYFNYMIASEESEAGYGWDYDTWVDDLYSKKSTEVILKAIVDGFIADNGGASSSSGDQTLSYMNLSYAAAYKTAWENLATQLNSKVTSSNRSSFNSAITNNIKHYGDSDYDYFCTFDAWDFVDKLANNSAFSSFRVDSSYTTAVKNAHTNLVTYNLAQKGAGVSKGLCMYWPNSTQYSDVSTYYTTSETTLTTWRSFCVNKGYHA